MKIQKDLFRTLCQGVAIGIGNIIPGVSGGTIALILGIYERLLKAISNINIQTIYFSFFIFSSKKEKREKFFQTMHDIDALFLACLGIGAISAIVCLAFVFTYFLSQYREVTFAFFAGLILFSITVPYKMLTRKSWKEFLMAFLALSLVVFLCFIKNSMEQKYAMKLQEYSKQNTIEQSILKESAIKVWEKVEQNNNEHNWGLIQQTVIYFCAGAIAISAMILPGISGSFLLLLLGLYFQILTAVKQCQLGILIPFALGSIIGLLLFTRLLKFLLQKYYNATMAFLIGLILGSMYGIWPFQNIISIQGVSFYGHICLPEINMMFWLSCIFFILGGVIVIFLEKQGQKIIRNA